MKPGHLDVLKNESVKNGQIKMHYCEVLFWFLLKMLIAKLFNTKMCLLKKNGSQSWSVLYCICTATCGLLQCLKAVDGTHFVRNLQSGVA